MMDAKNKAHLRQFWEIAGDSRKNFKVASLVMFVVLASELVKPLVLKQALDQMEAGDNTALVYWAWVYLGAIIFDYLSRSAYSWLFSIGLLRTINTMRDKMFRHVLHMKMAFFDQQPVGVLLTRTISDCQALGETLRAGAATIVIDLLTVVVVFAVMLHMDLGLSTAMLVAAPLLFLVVRWCGNKLREKFLLVRSALAASNGFMAEGIMGVEILQLFRQRKGSSDTYREINKTYRHATIVNNVYDASLYAIIDGLSSLVTALILTMAFNLRFGILEISTVIVYLTLVERIFTPIRDFSSKFATIQQALAALERIFGLLNKGAHIEQGSKSLSGDRLDIRFSDVSFRYREDSPLVLQNINFAVSPGQTIALVGQTGSGKSTIGKLMTRAYDGYEGDIFVGDLELKELNYHSLRKHVAVVHQEVELFPGTLRDNISMFDPNVSQVAIEKAIHLVKAEHMVSQLPGSYDFQVQENGGNLSAGQKQLIIFARALAHDAPIVLMDEATASVDSKTEAWIQEAISAIMSTKTVLVVAHRLSTIAAADKILVLKHGRIIEEGSHDQLLQIPQGYYASLVEASQMRGGKGPALL